MDFDYIGMFIRRYRQANNESLQSLADRSGVSRSMISKIESNQKSPTIVVLAKLASAMNIGLEDLVKMPDKHDEVLSFKPTDKNIVSKAGSLFVCHQLVAKSSQSLADCYQFYFKGHGKTRFAANPVNDTRKYLWVERGELTLYIASNKHVIEAGTGLMFNASAPHSFENRTGPLVRGHFFVAYPN